MARLWEGVPASPCSAASDDPHLHSGLPTMPADRIPDIGEAASPLSEDLDNIHKRPFTDNRPTDTSPPASKRPRPDTIDIDTASASRSASVEFVEARTPCSTTSPDFVARLNTSAHDERRKQLLLRLRAIDAKKAALAQRSPTPQTDNDNEIIVVDEKPAPASTKPARKSRARRATPSRRKPTRAKKPAPHLNQVIDVDAESSASSQRPRSKIPSRPKKTLAKPTPPAPTRTSSRTRRPRTPNADSKSTAELRVPTPTCMSKCTRFQFCKKLITSLLRNSRAGPFSAPVLELWPEEAIPRYFDVISRPMDLRTVKKNLETSVYISPCASGVLPHQFEVEKFIDDIRLVFRNAMVYNRAGDMLYNCARDLLEDFEKTMDEQLPPPTLVEQVVRTVSKKRSTGSKSRRSRSPSSPGKEGVVWSSDTAVETNLASATARPSKKDSWAATVGGKEDSETSELLPATVEEMRERLAHLRNSRTAVLARTPIPKGSGYLSRAALLYEVDISHSQKQRCVSAIESRVPIGKMEALIDMVKAAGGGYVAPEDDEFVFDFDNLDNSGWRNVEAFLEQFVPGFKTIRHSTLGREFNSVEEVDEEMALLQERLKGASAEEPKRKVQPAVKRPRSFFGADGADESSSDESGDDSDSSDESDSESEAE